MTSGVRYPWMREELLEYIKGLSDIEYQRRVWVSGLGGGGKRHDELDYAVHFLFDDTRLAKDPLSTVGWILMSEAEVAPVSKLISRIDEIFEKYGTGLTDEEYIALPEWGSVVLAAKEALTALRQC